MKKAILLLILLLLLACAQTQQQKDYEQCITLCSASIDEPNDIEPENPLEFVQIELCREECEKTYLS
tara:strand:- start:7543 stop:7743 length:201 start_codon:yes stop_codon:yes gene_type:complete